MSNITNNGQGDSNVEPQIAKQQTDDNTTDNGQNTPVITNGTPHRETPVSEGGSIQIDIGESPDEFIDTPYKEESELKIESRGSHNNNRERESTKRTPIDSERLVKSRNLTQTSARESQLIDNEEHSEIPRVNSNAVTVDQVNSNDVTVEKSVVSKGSRNRDTKGRGDGEGTEVRERRNQSTHNLDRTAKHSSMGIAKQSSMGTAKQSSMGMYQKIFCFFNYLF